MKEKQEQLFYTMSEVAHMLHLSPGTIRKLVSNGELQACKICGDWRFPIAPLESYIDKLCENWQNGKATD